MAPYIKLQNYSRILPNPTLNLVRKFKYIDSIFHISPPLFSSCCFPITITRKYLHCFKCFPLQNIEKCAIFIIVFAECLLV